MSQNSKTAKMVSGRYYRLLNSRVARLVRVGAKSVQLSCTGAELYSLKSPLAVMQNFQLLNGCYGKRRR